jgi:hypothetical protein
VVLPDASPTLQRKTNDQLLVKSFKDNKL